MQRLIPLCESITKLRAVCKICLGDAAFTFRIGTETDVEVTPPFLGTAHPVSS